MSEPQNNTQRHLSQETLLALQNGALHETESLWAAEHLAVCPACALRFADMLEAGGLTNVPSGFAQEVTARITQRKEKRRQFLFYSLRVAVAACAALVVVFSGMFSSPWSIKPARSVKAPNFSVVQTINAQLRDFSQQVLNWGAVSHDQTKK